jgi:hypothetical protein
VFVYAPDHWLINRVMVTHLSRIWAIRELILPTGSEDFPTFNQDIQTPGDKSGKNNFLVLLQQLGIDSDMMIHEDRQG